MRVIFFKLLKGIFDIHRIGKVWSLMKHFSNLIQSYVVNSNIICVVKYILWIKYFYLPILKCFKSVLATWINAYFGKKILSPRSNFFFLITRLRYKLNLGGDFLFQMKWNFPINISNRNKKIAQITAISTLPHFNRQFETHFT